MKTSKEKAIEDLKIVEYWFIKSLTKHGELATLLNTKTGVTESPIDIIERLKNELSKPTLDDAIKVVEEIAHKCKGKWSVRNVKNEVYFEVLTALKGLKEGKE